MTTRRRQQFFIYQPSASQHWKRRILGFARALDIHLEVVADHPYIEQICARTPTILSCSSPAHMPPTADVSALAVFLHPIKSTALLEHLSNVEEWSYSGAIFEDMTQSTLMLQIISHNDPSSVLVNLCKWGATRVAWQTSPSQAYTLLSNQLQSLKLAQYPLIQAWLTSMQRLFHEISNTEHLVFEFTCDGARVAFRCSAAYRAVSTRFLERCQQLSGEMFTLTLCDDRLTLCGHLSLSTAQTLPKPILMIARLKSAMATEEDMEAAG